MPTAPVRRLLGRLAGPDPGPDADLLGRFVAARDEAAFAELVRRHGPTVLGVCRRALGPGPDADDAFQATFLVLVRKARAVTPRAAVGGFLYGVAVRAAAHARAARARRRAKLGGLPDVPDPRRPGPDPDLPAVVDEELARLPDGYRAAVVLCELDGLSLKEAAGRLGVPPGTVASRLARGRKQLAARLARRGITGPVAGLLGAVAVPDELVAAVVGSAGAGGAAGGVSQLTDGVLKTMLVHKLKGLGRAAVAAGVAVVGAAAWVGPAASAPPKPEPVRQVAGSPVKPDPAADRKQLEEWWADLLWNGDDPKPTRAVLALSARPKEAVAFLRANLRPLRVGKDQVAKWVADLGSDNEGVWRPAFEAMQYLDPRLAVDLEAMMTDVTEYPARRRLVNVLVGFPPDALADTRVELRPHADGFNFGFAKINVDPTDRTGGKTATWAEHRVDRLGGGGWQGGKTSWTRAVRAVAVLEHIGTPDAAAVLKDLATGHPDAGPTKAAKQALGRLGVKAP